MLVAKQTVVMINYSIISIETPQLGYLTLQGSFPSNESALDMRFSNCRETQLAVRDASTAH